MKTSDTIKKYCHIALQGLVLFSLPLATNQAKLQSDQTQFMELDQGFSTSAQLTFGAG